MDHNRIHKLEKIITKGKAHFILINGVVSWGLLTGTLFLISRYFLEGKQSLRSIILILLIFPLFGSIWGFVMWKYIKNKYSKYLKVQ